MVSLQQCRITRRDLTAGTLSLLVAIVAGGVATPQTRCALAAGSETRAASPEDDLANARQMLKEFLDRVSVKGSILTIPEGRYAVAGRDVHVRRAADFVIDPAEMITVADKPLKLGKDRPQAWSRGCPLPGVSGGGGINASFSYVAGSLTIRKKPGGELLQEGKDYLVAPEFGMVGIGPEASVSPDDTVYAGYRYNLMRIDSIYVDADGQTHLAKGKPDITVPLPADIPESTVRLCNIFRPYGATEVMTEHLFPILRAPGSAVTQTRGGLVPRAIEKIKAGTPLTVVCMGDSVTQGGDASRPELRYVDVFRTMLTGRYASSGAAITVTNISYGGTASRQWLRMTPFTDEWFKTVSLPADQIDFKRIIAARPDVLTIEFVNDAGMDYATVNETYGTIIDRLKEFNTEIILITPHFTAMHWMPLKSIRDPDGRAYVKALYRFARERNLAVADASSRWAHLWTEGLPYVTLLRNSLNHPDDRGHRLFAEELMKCFESGQTAASRATDKSLIVGLLQMTPAGDDQAANMVKAERFCREAAAKGADIALMPEMWNIGYTRFDPKETGAREQFYKKAIAKDSDWVRHFARLAADLKMAVAVTYLQAWNGPPRNAVTLFDRHGKEVFTYAKVHTSDFKPLEAKMTPGDEFFVGDLDTRLGAVKVGAMICFDREQPESARMLMLKGAELILTPNSCRLEEMRLDQFKIRAWENVLGVAMANYPSPKNNGCSVAFDHRGRRLVLAGEEEGLFLAEFDLMSLRENRRTSIYGNAYRRPRRYNLLTSPEQQEVWKRSDGDGDPWVQLKR